MNENKQSVYMHWAKTHRQAKYSLATSGVLHYSLKNLGVALEDLEINGPTSYGFEPLNQALAVKCGVQTDCVAPAIGTSMANHLAMATLLERGDEVLVEQPTYEPLLAVARYLGASIKRFQRQFESGFCIDPQAIRNQISSKTKLIVVTNLHNPSGVFTSQEILSEVGSIAKEAGAKVLVDEVYLECTFPVSGSKYSAFHLGKQFITTGSLTKAYGLSGLRCGWVLGEPDVIRRVFRLNDLFAATPPHIAEILSVAALRMLPEIAQRAQQILQGNRKRLETILDSVNYCLDVVRPQYGTVVFPKLRNGNAEEFVRILEDKYDTSVVPGAFFESPGHFRAGIGGAPEEVKQGLENVKEALNSL